MKIIRNIFIIIVTIFYSFVTVSAAQGSPKDSYFSSVDKIYSELYDNQMITESVWNAILNQTHFLIYSSNVNPKSIYISALAFGTDILSSQSSTITSNIKSIKD
jgi:predicted RNA methylase